MCASNDIEYKNELYRYDVSVLQMEGYALGIVGRGSGRAGSMLRNLIDVTVASAKWKCKEFM